METGITKNRIIAELTRSPHGNLDAYLPVGRAAAKEEPEFLAHLIAWNYQKGEIRDSKVALPVIQLAASNDKQIADNALAHMASLDPRNLVRAVRFAKTIKTPGNAMQIRRVVEKYLRVREETPRWFNATAVQHKRSLRELYCLYHIKPSDYADRVVVKNDLKVGVFKDIAQLGQMDPGEAAGTILTKNIPFLAAVGALGDKAKDPRVGLALIESMSPDELLNNTAALERIGLKEVPALRAAYEGALVRAAEGKTNTFKAQRAAEAIKDEKLKSKLQAVQAKRMDKLGVDGDWLVICDKSGSMADAIESSRHIAATLAKLVSGEVHLVFVDNSCRYVKATGKTYEQLLSDTRLIQANGGTCLGGGVMYALDRQLNVDGIVVVSDGGENAPPAFCQAYALLAKKLNKPIPVYLYWVNGDTSGAMQRNMHVAGQDLQVFDLRGAKVDYYALPNLVQTMRTNRYSLIDEIMETPLLTLDQVFKKAA